MNEKIKCRIKVDKIFYPKNGKALMGEWTSFSCKVIEEIEGKPQLNKIYKTMACKGSNVPSIDKDEIYTLVATETVDPRWGIQYEVLSMGTDYNLDDLNDQKVFLSFILTEKQISVLYANLDNPFDVIKRRDLPTLTAIKGIGDKKAYSIIEKFEGNEMNGPVYVELASYGLTKNAMDGLIKEFGLYSIVDIIKENPYKLITLARGYGWVKADTMALTNGMHEHDPRRIKGYIEYLLDRREDEGHTYIDRQYLFDCLTETIENIPPNIVREVMHQMYDEKIIWWDETKSKIFLLRTLVLEKKITEELLRLKNAPSEMEYRDPEEILPSIEKVNGWEFTDEQKQAVKDALNSNVVVITGSAGTGKSSVVSAILQCCVDVNFAQTALAGRAAARLSEVTGEDGFTIHRLLGRKDGKFIYNKDNHLSNNLIILDEISMVGGYIFYSLIQAVQDGAKLIMLGDVGQLESIGVLNLFRDIIDSGTIAVNHLNKIHRQAAKSAIITASMHIRNQEQLFNGKFTGKEVRGDLQDLELDIYEESILSQRKIIKQYKKLLEEDKDPNDIQVIVPMKARGNIGTFVLNPILKTLANPSAKGGIVRSKMVGGNKHTYTLNVGDKVINVVNNYRTVDETGIPTPIYNGNMGNIEDIDEDGKFIVVNFFQWGRVLIPHGIFDNIELAYAITCHKIQGSQIPYVIVGIDDSAFMMLSKEWLYTAITRAQKYCILCGENKAVRTAISTSRIPEKQTMLCQLLNGSYPIESIPTRNIELKMDED